MTDEETNLDETLDEYSDDMDAVIGPVEKDTIEKIDMLHSFEECVNDLTPATYLEARQVIIYAKNNFDSFEVSDEGHVYLFKGGKRTVVVHRE